MFHVAISAGGGLPHSTCRGTAVQAGRLAKKKYPDNLLTIRYEELVTEPAATIQKICIYLQFDYQPQMLKATSKNTAYWEEGDITGISANFVNRWQSTLSATEIVIAQYLAREYMHNFSYPSLPTSTTSKLNTL